MAIAWTEAGFAESLVRRLAEPASRTVSLYWLGQAGFVIRTAGASLAIDPYLSDSLAVKYRGQRFPHRRMMPAPVTPEELRPLDLVLCTHQHTDHMDPATLTPMAALQPRLRFVVPRAARDEALRRTGAGEDRLCLLVAGETMEPCRGVRVSAVRTAHETLETDAAGHHRYLGYVIDLGGVRIFHAGDAVPFPGYVDEVSALRPDIALLPVNGRSPELRAAGIAGNMTLDEAIELCAQCRIPTLIAHHYGMFDFNTVPSEAIDRRAAQPGLSLALMRARTQVEYRACFP